MRDLALERFMQSLQTVMEFPRVLAVRLRHHHPKTDACQEPGPDLPDPMTKGRLPCLQAP